MDRDDEKKLTLDEYSWHVLNHLREFDSSPETVRDIRDRIVQFLPNHALLTKFVDYYDTALDYYDDHSVFPDMDWFKVNYAKTGKLKITDDDYSVQVVEDYIKLIEGEIIKRDMSLAQQMPRLDVSTMRALNSKIARFCDNAQVTPNFKKEDLINLYDNYGKNYGGIGTGIAEIDDSCGMMGYKSIAVFGAPSGHGKSTFAISVAFNNAMLGRCVDYITYEVPREHIWFNLVSLYSSVLDERNGIIDESDPRRRAIDAADMKEHKLTEAQAQYYQTVMTMMLQEIKANGGYINVLDQTTASVDTFEALKARIEAMATERQDGDNVFDRKADLIVVDNVDNFTVLKSSERDDMVRINKYIVELDAFCKEYHHGDGTTILLLTQLNRGGLQRLQRAQKADATDSEGSNEMGNVDVTVFQRFNALYEKSTYCLVGYSDYSMRIGADARMNVYAVKLRNRPLPLKPLKIQSSYRFSRIGLAEPRPVPSTQDAIDLINAEQKLQDSGLDMDFVMSHTDLDELDFED